MRAVDFLKKHWAAASIPIILAVLALTAVLFVPGTVVGGEQIEFQSNSQFFDGEVFVIPVVSDGATDKIHAEIPASELSQAADGQVSKDLTIDITSQDTSARYSTTSTSLRRISAFKPIRSDYFSGGWGDSRSDVRSQASQWAENNCFNLDGNGGIENGDDYVLEQGPSDYVYEYRAYCVRENGFYGNIAELSSPDKLFNTKIEVKADGETVQTATLSNSELGDGRCENIGEHVRACWTGFNPTGAGVPEPYNVYAIHSNTFSPQWRVISSQRYTTYNSYVRNDLIDQVREWRNGGQKDDVVSHANDLASQAAQPVSQGSFTDYQVTDSSYDNGQIRMNMDYSIAWPEFTFYVDGADYISVEKPVGQPKIVSTEGDKFGEKSSGTITADVKNVGNAEGSFSARIKECSNGFAADSLQQTKTVDPGETVSYSFRVSFTSGSFDQKTISGQCDIEVSDTGDSSNSDTTSVGVEAAQSNECTPDEEFVRAVNLTHSRILQCSSDGLTTDVVEVCGDGEEAAFRDESWTCVSQDNPLPGNGGGDTAADECVIFSTGGLFGPQFELKNPFCGDGLLSKLTIAFHLVAGTAVALFTGNIGYRAGRWIDGENQIKGGFDPLKSRSVSRVKRGRFLVGLAAGVVTFLLGFYIILLVPIWAQLAIIAGYTLFKFYTPF